MKPQKKYPDEVYLNGKWLKHDQAFVSVFDRGFMFGDGVYEVTPFYSGKPFLLKEHLKRLEYSLSEIQIKFDAFSLEEKMLEAISRAGLDKKDAAVYIQLTRGAAPRTHFFPEKIETTVLLYAFPVRLEGFEKKQCNVLISKDNRWHRCDIKSTALMANIMANEDAIAGGYGENLLERNGYFTEGSHTSIFFVKYGVVHTHPEGPNILSGITRQFVIDLCKELGIKVKEKAVHVDELVEVNEVFLTGTTTQVLAVNSMQHKGKEVFRTKDNRITVKIQQKFMERVRG